MQGQTASGNGAFLLLLLLLATVAGCTLTSLAFKRKDEVRGVISECVLSNASVTLPLRTVPVP